MANIFRSLKNEARKIEWFENFLYIFKKHWNQIENYRIDKYLSFIRLHFACLLEFVVSKPKYIEWYQRTMLNLTVKSVDELTPEGICLQIADVFIAELNKIKPDCSLDLMARLLEPFLKSLGQLEAGRIKDRIVDKIFKPLLENNTTMTQMDLDELEEADRKHRYVDGAKLPPQRRLQIQRILDTKYVFSCFNILVYAQNHILRAASSDETNEEARDCLYELYELALKLEPKPDRPEPTTAQIQMINRARSFVTKKMKKR